MVCSALLKSGREIPCVWYSPKAAQSFLFRDTSGWPYQARHRNPSADFPFFSPDSPDAKTVAGEFDYFNDVGDQYGSSGEVESGSYSSGKMAESPDSHHDIRARQLWLNRVERSATS